MIGGINNASYLKNFNLTVYLEILIIKYAEVFCLFFNGYMVFQIIKSLMMDILVVFSNLLS